MAFAVDTFGGLDCAHNNAGIAAPMAPLADYPDDGWARTLDVMLNGVYYCMKAEIPRMLDRGGGAIVNTASGVGLVAYPHQAAYTASKHGVIGLTKVAALDYGAQGIRVNAVCPGTARTPMVDEAIRRQPSIDDQLRALHPDRPDRRGIGDRRGRGLAVHTGGVVRPRGGPARRRGLRGPVRTTPTSATVRRLADQGHLMGDRWQPSAADGVHLHRYAATGAVQAEVGLAGAADVDRAVAAARAAQPAWAALGPDGRSAVLTALADLLEAHREEASELAALDNGTPVSVLRPGRYTAAWVRYYADLAPTVTDEELAVSRGTAAVRLVPYGVVGVVPPWNGSMMGMGQKCGPALAAGNTVVVKPPELAPFGMLRFGELALEAGVPPGVVNIVVGGATAGTALAGHPGVDKLTFTGGAGTARAVMAAAAANLTPLALELGGKSPNIVFADADLDAAATVAALAGTALLSGQGCALPTRTYVHEDRLRRSGGPGPGHAGRPAGGGPPRPGHVRGAGGHRGGHGADPRRDRSGRRRRGHAAGRRRATGWRPGRWVVRRPDRLRRRRPRQRPGPQRGVRPGAGHPPVLHRRRGHGQGQRQPLRAGRLRAHHRPRAAWPGSSTG